MLFREKEKLACVASVCVWFRTKQRGTRVKDRAKNGASERAGRGVALVSFLALSRTKMPFLGLPLLRSQGKTQLDGFARTGALIWNGLPKSLKSFSKSQFKSQIKQILLRFLQKTDDYIGVPQILCDISKCKCYNILPILSELFHSFPCLPPISFNIKLISVTLQTSFCIVIFYVDKLSLLF